MQGDGGLEGVVVAETLLSEVDGQRGRLLVGGMAVEELAPLGFEAACGLLWDGELPDGSRRAALGAALGAARQRAWGLLGELGGALSMHDAMDALRAAVGHMVAAPTWPQDAIDLTAAVAVFAAAHARIAAGRVPVEPDPRRGHADDYLRMVHGEAPSESRARAMSTYLATVCDHGMNASTFAARTVASTESDMVSAVVAGIGALKGRLHGGAPGPVLDMLDAIVEAPRAEAWLRGELTAGRRIMGFGHRVYRARDPRAAVLERSVRALEGAETSTVGRVNLAREVEGCAERLLALRKPSRPLRANVEFYTAVLLEALAIERTSFTATFAVARVAGWAAHVAEQRRRGRLIRPRARYVGPRPAA